MGNLKADGEDHSVHDRESLDTDDNASYDGEKMYSSESDLSDTKNNDDASSDTDEEVEMKNKTTEDYHARVSGL